MNLYLCRRVIRDLDSAAADQCAAAGASTEFRQSHAYRHNSAFSFPVMQRLFENGPATAS